MPRAFWKGVISFGLVAIPVKMYVGTESKTLSFHQLHKKCLTRPKQVLHCETDDEYFSTKETVRGYEVDKDQWVVLEERDFEKVPIKTSHSIEIHGFAEAKEIDPLYYYGIHYLQPEELGIKPFLLLRQALEQTGRVGIAKVSFQRREHLACLRPIDDILALHTMHYGDEILSRKELAPPKSSVTKAELDLAISLVTAMGRGFNPVDYKDEYREALSKVVEAKIKGEKIIAPPAPKIEIEDLMAALRASIAEAKREPAVR